MRARKNNNRLQNLKKKAQEEITGFVLIIVLVAIIFLVFLAFSIKPSKSTQESKDVYAFLESAMEFTTSCAIGFEPAYSSLADLIRECYSNSICTSGKTACSVLNSTLNELLSESWKLQNTPIKGYSFNSTLVSNFTQESIIYIKKGECAQNIRGAEYLSSAFSQTIVTTLKICY